jgi:hypothetical protein
LDAKDLPLGMTTAYAKDLHAACLLQLGRTGWTVEELSPWTEIFLRADEDDLETLVAATSDPKPWVVLLRICLLMTTDVVSNSSYVSSTDLQDIHRSLAEGRRRLRAAAVVFESRRNHAPELAKLLAENLGMKLLRYDMSEYQEKHSIAKLIGAPPGYVGYDDGNLGGGMLISDIEKNPNSIILMDEIEKAHHDVSNILLTLMDEGVITSSNGKKVDCRNCMVVLTSNLGSADNERNSIGFGRELQKTGEDDKAVKDFFKPEFRNRLDGIIKFNKLNKLSMRKIVTKFVGEVNDLMSERAIKLRLSEAAVDHLIETGFDAKMGARPLHRKINEAVKVPLSKKILFDNIQPNSLVLVDYVNNELTFEVQSQFEISPQPMVDTNGFIVLDPVKS